MNLRLTIGPIVSLIVWHFDPYDAANAELYRRDLSAHYQCSAVLSHWGAFTRLRHCAQVVAY